MKQLGDAAAKCTYCSRTQVPPWPLTLSIFLHCELAGMIERLTGKTGPASQRAHIDDHTTLLTSLRILIPKDAQGPLGHVDHTPKVGIKHSSRLAILGAFGVAGESVTGVVDDDIDTAKLLQGGANCGINASMEEIEVTSSSSLRTRSLLGMAPRAEVFRAVATTRLGD